MCRYKPLVGKEEVNFTLMVKHITFDIICKVLFGRDVVSTTREIPYIDVLTRQKSTMTFEDSFYQVFLDILTKYGNLRSNMFPFLED